MSAVVTDKRSDAADLSGLDDVLYQSVVDDEFREQLVADPASFGFAGAPPALPDAIEAQDRTGLDLVSGTQYTAQCKSTCSQGPLTIICDGTTK
jgi:hypothetical protein